MRGPELGVVHGLHTARTNARIAFEASKARNAALIAEVPVRQLGEAGSALSNNLGIRLGHLSRLMLDSPGVESWGVDTGGKYHTTFNIQGTRIRLARSVYGNSVQPLYELVYVSDDLEDVATTQTIPLLRLDTAPAIVKAKFRPDFARICQSDRLIAHTVEQLIELACGEETVRFIEANCGVVEQPSLEQLLGVVSLNDMNQTVSGEV